MILTEQDFLRIVTYIKRRTGIELKQKKVLVVGRLENYLVQNGFSSYGAYMDLVEKDPSGKEAMMLINRLTTNHTYFMREPVHFYFLRDRILPILKEKEKHTKDIRIWSAAASSGEEAYTTAMLLHDFFGLEQGWDTTILATDISTKSLEKAQKGEFLQEQIAELPESWRRRYFKKTGPQTCVLTEEIRKGVLFRYFNLMEPFPFRKKFHVIFLRNVMIYFDEDTKVKLLEKMYQFLEPGGYLFIGTTETLDKTRSNFQYIQPSIYRKG